MNAKHKRIWPHATICRMSHHIGSDQWYKTVRGREIYFGVGRDPDAALAAYLRWAEAESAISPAALAPPPAADLTLNLCLNHFLNAKLAAVNDGNLSAGQYVRYRNAVRRIFAAFGKQTLITDLQPAHFERLRKTIRGGPVTVNNAIRDMRVAFKWADDTYHVRPTFGQSFKRPTARAIRRGSGKRELWEAKDIRAVLAVAQPNIRAMVLLGINCGFGQGDCANFTRDSFTLDGHAFRRPKTDIERACPFWPETIAAIADIHRWRPDAYPGHVFVSKYGRLLVRDDAVRDKSGNIVRLDRKDAIREMLRRACEAAGVKARPFYSLRHTFYSVANRIPDTQALHCIMGWIIPGMAGVYGQLLADDAERLKAVTNCVHDWLFS